MKLLGIGSRIKHPEFGVGVVTNLTDRHYWVTFVEKGHETIDINSNLEIIEALDYDEIDSVSLYEVEKSLKNILLKWSDITPVSPIAEKFKGGKLILEPKDTNLKSKEVPIDTFFHKIVMVRDRIRVMEQKINSSKNLDDQEKVDLQQYITRIYGSLTTFNVLFQEKHDYFVGERSK
jgi:hypothetical protein